MDIRIPTSLDIPHITELMNQLGYPTTIEQMTKRFTHIQSLPYYHTLVAEEDKRVVALVGLSTGVFYEHDGVSVRIVAFVVHKEYRRRGIGEKLLKAAEQWAILQGATGIGLNSGNREERQAAHAFYQTLGYEAKSTGFQKQLRKE